MQYIKTYATLTLSTLDRYTKIYTVTNKLQKKNQEKRKNNRIILKTTKSQINITKKDPPSCTNFMWYIKTHVTLTLSTHDRYTKNHTVTNELYKKNQEERKNNCILLQTTKLQINIIKRSPPSFPNSSRIMETYSLSIYRSKSVELTSPELRKLIPCQNTDQQNFLN